MEIPAAGYTRGHMYDTYDMYRHISTGVYEAQFFRIENSYMLQLFVNA